jgi:hypothetical protein
MVDSKYLIYVNSFICIISLTSVSFIRHRAWQYMEYFKRLHW